MKLSKSILLIFLLGLCTPLAFAQGKIIKYIPKAGKGTKIIPAPINPKLPPAVRANFAMPVVRPNISEAMRCTTPAKVTKAVTTPPVVPVTFTMHDTGANLTGIQVLAHYYPAWRQELGAMFTKEQLDAVEKAFADTDDWIFVRGEDGELKIRNKDEWNYETRFLTILKDSGVSFTERQIKQLQGSRGMKGFTFKTYFTRMNATGFSCAKGIKPRADIMSQGRKLPREEMTPEEVEEAILGKGLMSYRNHPAVQAYIKENRITATKHTAEEYVAMAQRYPTKPRFDITRNGRRLSREEMTPEEVQEVMIGRGLNTHRNHPAVQAYMKENRRVAESRTPEEYVALARQYPARPRTHIYREGRSISREEMTPEEIEEVAVAQGLYSHMEHPLVRAYLQEVRTNAEVKSPEEYVALARSYPTKPRANIYKNGRRLSREEMTPEEIQEVNIGRGLNYHKTHSLVQSYLQEHQIVAERRTPEEYVALARQYTVRPRAEIYKNGHPLSRAEMTPEELQERTIGKGLYTHRDHPLVQAYLQETRQVVQRKATQELYTDLVAYIKEYGRYPLYGENSLYTSIYNRLRYHQSTMTTDGKYADPWLQKIYELKTAVQNAPEGKFTFTPDGQGGYTLEIEEPVAEGLDLSAPQKVEEVAPAVPSRHALYEHITEDIKNMILQARDQAALQRHEFYPWLRDMTQNHLDQIVNKETSDALWTLNRAINFDYRNHQNRRAVTYLLQTVNNYVGILGVDEHLGYFNKIIYRGKLEPGMLPQADLFHVVAEQEGMSWNGDVVPQVGDVNKAYAQAIKRGENPGVFLDGDENMVTAIGIAPRVPLPTVKQDLENMIQQLLPPGFEVRMGLHELGISGNNLTKFRKGHLHIHLERPATTEEMQDGFLTDVSISLNIKADRFAGRWNRYHEFEPFWDKQIAQNYLILFDSFLDQAAKDKLNELIR